METIGMRIKSLRKARNITQLQLSEATSIHRGNVGKYESDKVAPSAQSIIELARYFDVSCDWLLTGQDANTSPANAVASEHTSYNDKEQHIITCYRQLSKEDQLLFLGRLEGASGNY